MPACVLYQDRCFRLFFNTMKDLQFIFSFEKSSDRFNLIYDDIYLSILLEIICGNVVVCILIQEKENRMRQLGEAQANEDFHFQKKWRSFHRCILINIIIR